MGDAILPRKGARGVVPAKTFQLCTAVLVFDVLARKAGGGPKVWVGGERASRLHAAPDLHRGSDAVSSVGEPIRRRLHTQDAEAANVSASRRDDAVEARGAQQIAH